MGYGAIKNAALFPIEIPYFTLDDCSEGYSFCKNEYLDRAKKVLPANM
jgi:hypothetical protein